MACCIGDIAIISAGIIYNNKLVIVYNNRQ